MKKIERALTIILISISLLGMIAIVTNATYLASTSIARAPELKTCHCAFCSLWQKKIEMVNRSFTITTSGRGQVYEVRAVPYSAEDNIITLEDEHGTLWDVENMWIEEGELVLLWLADNDTPEDNTDDIIIKVWHE